MSKIWHFPRWRYALRGAALVGLIVILPPLSGSFGEASAQCMARVQTGVGSNIAALAQRCGTTVGDIRRANPGRDLNRPGLVAIPGGRTSVVPNTLNNTVAPAPPPIRATRQRPVVQPAPTFRQPGQAPLRRSSLDAGWTDTASYGVRRGDTLSGIAAARGISVQSLIQANPGIQPNRLAIGQTIHIPTR